MASCLPAPPCHAGVDEDEDKTKARLKASLLPFPSPNSPSPNASSRTRTRSPTPTPPQDPRRRPLRPPPPPRLPTVIDRPNHHSCCWRQFVAGYFVLNAAADSSALPLPEPQLIINAANLGIIACLRRLHGRRAPALRRRRSRHPPLLLLRRRRVGRQDRQLPAPRPTLLLPRRPLAPWQALPAKPLNYGQLGCRRARQGPRPRGQRRQAALRRHVQKSGPHRRAPGHRLDVRCRTRTPPSGRWSTKPASTTSGLTPPTRPPDSPPRSPSSRSSTPTTPPSSTSSSTTTSSSTFCRSC
ncbi:hypothetical protein GQ55_5G544000 [Panicum hallii var. hallii]|uniref:Uncharacterized protein n=1 Tax=Panicum hallii var. hallii TaxID=1504633 RepID=A0A2T7DTI4_9POAL|nr:hypothetical protein GQ55_5G544000 [Panicum hallii var. hallii]